MSALGDAIRAARLGRKMSLREVAAPLGVSIPFIGEVERGTRTLSWRRLRDVATLLDLAPGHVVAATCEIGAVDVSDLSPAQVAEVVALVERLRAVDPAPAGAVTSRASRVG